MRYQYVSWIRYLGITATSVLLIVSGAGCGGQQADQSGGTLSGAVLDDRPESGSHTDKPPASQTARTPDSTEGLPQTDAPGGPVVPAESAQLHTAISSVLPENFPSDIPLGNWLRIEEIRAMSETDFVVTCGTAVEKVDVIDYFIENMSGNGWDLVTRSDKPGFTVSILNFSKDARKVMVMVRRADQDGLLNFDISYIEG